MGIPHLKRNLEPFAERGPIKPGNVIIDGPALAYHIHGLCLKGFLRSSPHEQPSYRLLGETTLAWLNRIESLEFNITKIYFDGSLPDAKRPERMRRLLQSSKQLQSYYLSNPGVGVSRHPLGRRYAVKVTPKPSGTGTRPSPLPPAFLVPAVIEALRASQYSDRTEMVPGEADVFCAAHARSMLEAVIFTSDSDLLLYDLARDTRVVFFPDIDFDKEREECGRLTGLQFLPNTIRQRLSVNPKDGLLRLAFAMINNPQTSLEEAVAAAKRSEEDTETPEEFEELCRQYRFPETMEAGELHGTQELDPRVSEVALNCASTDPDIYGQKLAMYLPCLLDCPDRASAWEASQECREMAYSIFQLLNGPQRRERDIIEFRRLQTLSGGSRVNGRKSPKDLQDGLIALHVQISRIGSYAVPKFVTLSLCWDLRNAVEKGQSVPLCLKVLRQCFLTGLVVPESWDFTHLFAQVQATFYSLRMLLQALQFASANYSEEILPTSMRASMELLRAQIAALPPLASFPSLGEFAKHIKWFVDGEGLEAMKSMRYDGLIEAEVADMLDWVKIPADMSKKEMSESKRKRKASVSERGVRRAATPTWGNPYEALDRQSEDD